MRRRLLASVLAATALVIAPAGLVAAQEPTTTPAPTTTPTTVTQTTPTTVTQTTPTTLVETTTTTADPGSTSTTEEPQTSTTPPPVSISSAVPSSPAAVAESLTEEQRQDLAESDALTKEELELLNRYIASRLRLGSLKLEINRAVSEYDKAQKEIMRNVDRVRAAETQWRETNRKLEDAQAKLNASTARLQSTAVESYINGGVGGSSTAAILKAETVDDLTRGRVYVGAVVDDEQGLVEQHTEARDWVNNLKADADRQFEAASAAREAVRARSDEAERQLEQKQAAMAAQTDALAIEEEILGEIAVRKAAWTERQASTAAASGSIETVLQRFGTLQGPAAEWTDLWGTMEHPVARARLSQQFGNRVHPIFGTSQGHQGIDLAIATGEPILAAEDGWVLAAADAGDGYGNKVILGHANKVGTLYAHQSRIAVEVGQEVRRGDVIGFIGSTGYSTGPHLHWEVRINGTPVDPAPMIGLPPRLNP